MLQKEIRTIADKVQSGRSDSEVKREVWWRSGMQGFAAVYLTASSVHSNR